MPYLLASSLVLDAMYRIYYVTNPYQRRCGTFVGSLSCETKKGGMYNKERERKWGQEGCAPHR